VKRLKYVDGYIYMDNTADEIALLLLYLSVIGIVDNGVTFFITFYNKPQKRLYLLQDYHKVIDSLCQF